MGRILHYRILADRPLAPEIWHVIETVRHAMNTRFTWTCGNLKLEPVSDEQRRGEDHMPDLLTDAPVQVYGFTQVLSDEWNAVLVVRFVQWLSALLPQAKVKLHDEGDYVRCGCLIYEAGEPRPDCVRIARRCAYLKSQGMSEELKQLADAAQCALLHDLYFAQFPATDYADREEFAALQLPDRLGGLSLGDAAERMQFPWQDEAT